MPEWEILNFIEESNTDYLLNISSLLRNKVNSKIITYSRKVFID